MQTSPQPLLIRVAPAVFVLLWSSGFLVVKYASPYIDPLTFLCVRFAFAVVLIAALAVLARAPWPRGAALGHCLVAGILIHAGYLIGVWWSISRGLPAGISGLISALQPLVTAMLARSLVGEILTRRQWSGVMIGFGGIVLVLGPQLQQVDLTRFDETLGPLLVNSAGILSVTLGTFYQKRFLPTVDLRSATCLQYVGALAVTLPLALATETLRFTLNATTVFVMAWSVLVLSLAAVGLLLLMIRHGEVSRTASLIYLMAPLVVLQAWLYFGEALTPIQLLGMAATAVGVRLTTQRA